jgi:hypothetical protein
VPKTIPTACAPLVPAIVRMTATGSRCPVHRHFGLAIQPHKTD